GHAFMAFSTATGLSRFTDIPWPKGLAPQTGPTPAGNGKGPLPRADVLVVTWTVDEGHAVSRVLTPGKDSRNDYLSYTHNFAAISSKMRVGCPALQANRLGQYWATKIGKKKVVVFKSDSHLSQDTKKLPAANGTLPNYDLWKQIVEEVQPQLVITTCKASAPPRRWATPSSAWSPAKCHRRPAGSPCATSPIHRSKPKARSATKPPLPRKSTKASAAGAPSAAPSSAGR